MPRRPRRGYVRKARKGVPIGNAASAPRVGASAGSPAGPVSARPSRRELFALAAVLAATVLTAGLAIAGLTRTAEPAQPATPTVAQIIGQAPAQPPRVEPGD